MQHNKIKGLGLEEIMDCIIVTDDYENAGKPSVISYNMVMDMLQIDEPSRCIYIGDNPRKDFVGAREVGMHTVRIVRSKGMFMSLKAEQGYDADVIVKNLKELLHNNY